MTTATKTRQTADERREAIAKIALEEFAARGLHGTPTSEIARKAGISHAYLFRLFPTKTELFIAATEGCFDRTLAAFKKASEGMEPGEDCLHAMGEAYVELLSDRSILLSQMQAYTACDDPDIRAAVQLRFGELVKFVAEKSGAGPERVQQFFAFGMLLNVAAAMNLPEVKEPWAVNMLPEKLR